MISRQVLNRASPYVFIAPAVLITSIALVYPVLQSIWLSFHEWSIGTPPDQTRFVGLENYRWLLADRAFWTSVGVTLVFAGAVVLCETVLGVGLALALDRELRGMSIIRTIFILPMMVAPIVVGLIWRFLYNEQFGPLNQVLTGLGLPAVSWLSSPDLALVSVIIADIWQWTPFIFILSLAALQSLPSSAIEAARIDGASPWQAIVFIKLPLMMPVIVVAALLRLIDAFKVLEVIYILTEGGPGLSTEILSLHIYKTAFVSQQLGRASALSNLLLVMVMAITLALVAVNHLRRVATRRADAAEG
jgi:multiple sugar transport system permease protein